MPDHSHFANLIWQIADLLRGPYRSLPVPAVRARDAAHDGAAAVRLRARLVESQGLAEHVRRKGGKLERYQSEKADGEDAWQHTTIRLHPANTDFEPIALTEEDEEPLQVVAEVVEVLGTGT